MLWLQFNFEVDSAHCWNEDAEAKIKAIIASGGTENFNQTIQSLGAALLSVGLVEEFDVPAQDLDCVKGETTRTPHSPRLREHQGQSLTDCS